MCIRDSQMTVSTSRFITERLGVIEHELGDVDKRQLYGVSGFCVCDISVVQEICTIK